MTPNKAKDHMGTGVYEETNFHVPCPFLVIFMARGSSSNRVEIRGPTLGRCKLLCSTHLHES